MYAYQLLIVPVCCAATAEPRCRADPVYRPCWPVSLVYFRMTRSHVTAAVFQTRARFYDTFTSDFVEWRSTVLWVLERRRARSSRSVCCEGSFGDSRWEWGRVTERYDWRSPGASPLSRSTVFSPHRDTVLTCLTIDTLITSSSQVQVLLATTTDARHHQPFAARPMTPAVRIIAVVHYAVATTRLLLCACCLLLAPSFGWHPWLYTMLYIPFPCLPVGILLDTVLSHNYRILLSF